MLPHGDGGDDPAHAGKKLLVKALAHQRSRPTTTGGEKNRDCNTWKLYLILLQRRSVYLQMTAAPVSSQLVSRPRTRCRFDTSGKEEVSKRYEITWYMDIVPAALVPLARVELNRVLLAQRHITHQGVTPTIAKLGWWW